MTDRPEPNSIEDFADRLRVLMDEAKSYGIAGAAVICESDPITETESKSIVWRGGVIQCTGLLRYAEMRLMHDVLNGTLNAG